MLTTGAFLVQEYSDDEKRRLQLVGATYSYTVKGYFLSAEQMEKFEHPESLPTPTIKTTKGPGIFIENMGDVWKVYGDTYNKRDKIKQYGAKWNNSDKSWRIPIEKVDKETLENSLK
jgi:hypothetical protein